GAAGGAGGGVSRAGVPDPPRARSWGLRRGPSTVYSPTPPGPDRALGACNGALRPLTSAGSAAPPQVRASQRGAAPPSWRSQTLTVKLSEVLAEPAVLLDLDGRDKWQAIGELSDCLVATGQVPPEHRDAVPRALVAREKSMSTGMENGIAIPHTSVPQLEHAAVAL